MTVATLQEWLNSKGAGLTVDGKGGPKTRSAIIETFRNTSAPGVNDADIVAIASKLGCTTRQIRAFAKVEAGGGGWDDKGLLKCLWERHWLFRRVKLAIPLISDPKPGGYTIDADRDGINDSWEKLADAACRFGEIAFECASFGKFQVMGGHWKALGYPSVLEMVWALSRDEAAHYDQFARYIQTNNLAHKLRQVSPDPEHCRAIAAAYNGAGYRKFDYHVKIAKAMA